MPGNWEEKRNRLYKRDGHKCHYCGIDEKDFIPIWGSLYGCKRGWRLEIDRKDNKLKHEDENCVLACALCNMAKSDKLTYDEFKKVGNLIREIWQQRKKSGVPDRHENV